nr:AC087852_2 putative reverse transcriptase [Ipomoea batatas]
MGNQPPSNAISRAEYADLSKSVKELKQSLADLISNYTVIPKSPQPVSTSLQPALVEAAPITNDDTTFCSQYTRMEFPTFSGHKDPLIWLHHYELYFHTAHTPVHAQVELTAFNMTGEAQLWADSVRIDQQVDLLTAGLDELLQIDVERSINEEEESDETTIEDLEVAEISLHAITGVSTREMMKLRVLIEGTPLLALVDTGSTHNFINTSTALGLALHTAPRPGVKVVVVNEDSLSCTGLCEQVLVFKGSDSFLVNLFQIPLVGFDLVLGIQWLSTLGPIWWDFNSLTMQFRLEGKLVSWSSNTPHALAAISSLLPASNKDILNVLLLEFDPLFREVSTLPPSRSCDHRIVLSAGSDPVTICPYRYPQVLKDEIEKQYATGMGGPSSSTAAAAAWPNGRERRRRENRRRPPLAATAWPIGEERTAEPCCCLCRWRRRRRRELRADADDRGVLPLSSYERRRRCPAVDHLHQLLSPRNCNRDSKVYACCWMMTDDLFPASSLSSSITELHHCGRRRRGGNATEIEESGRKEEAQS